MERKKKTLRHSINMLRAQPMESRRQALIFLSFFCTFIVVLFWVFTLKARFTEEAFVAEKKNTTSLIKENVTRVYSDTTKQK